MMTTPATSIDLSPAQKKLILRKRARQLAKEEERVRHAASPLDIVEFRLGDEHYGIESGAVREVYAVKALTPLPGTPPHVLGIINVRGQILPVIDLRKVLGLPGTVTSVNAIIIAHSTVAEVGVHIDVIVGVREVVERLQDAPATLGVRAQYLKGVTADRLAVLDIERLVASTRLAPAETVEPDALGRD